MQLPIIIIEVERSRLRMISCRFFLLVTMTAGSCGVVASVGFSTENSPVELREDVIQYELCVQPGPAVEMTTITIVYQSISALAGEDYVDRTFNLTLSNTTTPCFNTSITNDNRYELQEEFLVNITALDHTTLSYLIIVILDEDSEFNHHKMEDLNVLQISWVSPEYRVQEDAGTVEVCVQLTGTYAALGLVPTFRIILTGITAREGTDYASPANTAIVFNAGMLRCYNIQILSDIEFEGDKNLTVDVVPTVPHPGLNRIDISPATRVVIIDYNVIVQWQPQSVCEGLRNLINTTLADNMSCNVQDCVAVVCESVHESLRVATRSCNNVSIELTVMAQDGSSLLYQVLYSMREPQVLGYASPRGQQQLSVSLQVETVNQSQYYIVGLSASSGIQLPVTAVPVPDCIRSNVEDGLAPGYILAVAAVGSTFAVMLMANILILLLSKSKRIRRRVHSKFNKQDTVSTTS